MSNTYYTSDGIGVSKPAIDQRVRRAKAEFLEELNNDEVVWCAKCGTVSTWLGVSHKISINESQKTRRVELAWDKDNLQLLCNPCHQKYDGNDVKLNFK